MRHLILAAAASLALAVIAHAQDSAQNGSAAVTASGQAAGALAASGVQTASALAVLPASTLGGASVVGGLSVATAGSVAVESADGSTKVADGTYGGGPLLVDRRVVVAQPRPVVPYDAAKPHP